MKTIQLHSRYAKSEEERARNMRRTYGQNTIVWFLRGYPKNRAGIAHINTNTTW